MLKRKIFSLTALIMCVVMLLSACSSGSETVFKSESDIIGEDGTFLYKMVYEPSLEENELLFGELMNIYNQIREAFDIKVIRNADSLVQDDSNNYELLLGNTNRPESDEALKLLESNRVNNFYDYLIKQINNKICIVAGSEEALSVGLRYFVENFCTSLKDFAKLNGNFEYLYAPEFEVEGAKIAGVSVSEYVAILPTKKSLLWSEMPSKLSSYLLETAGITFGIANDDTAEQEKEILVGYTNRSQSIAAEKGWFIKMDGKKLVVNGADDVQIAAAMKHLLTMAETAVSKGETLTIPADYSASGTAEKNSEDYYLAWADEFNSKTVDRTIWKDYSRNTLQSSSCMGGTVYKPDARDIYLENGNLVVPAYRLSEVDFQSGQCTTEGTVAARYGIIEFRVKFPESPVTTALWAVGADYILDEKGNKKDNPLSNYASRSELDIVESFGSDTEFHANVHRWFDNENLDFSNLSGHTALDGSKFAELKKFKYTEGKLSDDYHIYSVRWTPYEMSFAFDGEVYFKYDLVENSGTDFTRIPMNFLIGASYAAVNYGPQVIEDDATKSTGIYVDYFRIYQTDEYDSILWLTPYK